jgi:uncharacterized YccA/Bax inhibitor family protein
MALFESSNPTLSQKIFDKSLHQEAAMQGTMSVRGAINKFGFLMLMVIAGAAFTWQQFYSGQPESMLTYMLTGLFGGFAVAIAISFKPTWAPFLAPVYGVLQGLALGALSAIINQEFVKTYPGLVMQAVGLTFAVAIAMFLLYNFRVIKATERFKSIMYVVCAAIAVFYLIDVTLFYVFHIDIPITSWSNSSWTSIGFSILMIIIAALRLIIDFDRIEQGAATGAPKFMEWYSAFGLLVTLVWLYIEILKLLTRFASRD